ncbi:hypothetical protein D6833_09250, partial [Candidatus Parcubacteria bacterium]
SPYLPREIVFWNSGRLLWRDTKSQQIAEQPYHEPFDAGFTQAVYRAEGFRVFGALHLPARFVLDVYRPSPPGQGSQPIRYLSFEGALSIGGPLDPVSNIQVPPPLRTRTIVYDHRVMLQSGLDEGLVPISYLATNAWLVSTNDPRFQRVVRDNLKLQRVLRSQRFSWSVPQLIVASALTLLLVGPAVVFLRGRAGASRTKTQT